MVLWCGVLNVVSSRTMVGYLCLRTWKQVDDSLLKSHHEESEKGLDHKENVNVKTCSSQLWDTENADLFKVFFVNKFEPNCVKPIRNNLLCEIWLNPC